MRGSIGLRQDFLTLDNGVKREDSVKDIGALLDWIATRPELDADARHGHGRQLRRLHDARGVDALQRPHPRPPLDVVGISNFVTFLENTEGYRRDLRRAEYGDERDPEDRGLPRPHRPAEQRAQDHEAAVRRPGRATTRACR